MATIRVNRNNGYTIMSNYHFKDNRLSLKAKGLLSLMFSLPEDWDYSVKGLVSLCKEQTKCIEGILAELKEVGYLRIVKLYPNQTNSGRIEYIYDIYEYPMDSEKQDPKKQPLEIQALENGGLNKILNNKVLNNERNEMKERVIVNEEINKKSNRACVRESVCTENKEAFESYNEACEIIVEDIALNQDKDFQKRFAETMKNIGKYLAKALTINVCGETLKTMDVLNTFKEGIETGQNDEMFIQTIKEISKSTLNGKIKGNQMGYLVSTLYKRISAGGLL